ncbi:MAG: hypothetical protein Q9182_005047 [Xanthomendoza sp. 2 TL-2023]
MSHTDITFEQIDARANDSSSSTTKYEASISPPFQYNASLHSLDTTPSQTHPEIGSLHSPTPLTAITAGLQQFEDETGNQGIDIATSKVRLQTHLSLRNNRSTHISVPSIKDTEIPIYQASTSLLSRSSSLRSALSASASRHRAGSLSPNSAFSSPGLGPLVDMTPLPSPMAALGSPNPWSTPFNQDDVADRATSIMTDNAGDGLMDLARSSPKKRRLPLRIDPEVAKINAASHARNRSLSDYVPEGISIPRSRNIAVSGSLAPMSATPRSPADEPMHREEYLAIQRGLALPIPKPPTPPRSDEATEDSSEIINRSLSPPFQPQPQALTYNARVLRTGKEKSWRAIRQLGKGTFSTVMLATSEDVKHASFDGHSLADETVLDPKSLVAVKICEQGPAGGADEQKVELSLKRELEIMKSISHPSLVHLKAVSIEDRRALLILNYCPGGDLFDLASLKLELLVPNLIQRIFTELVAAVRYLHAQYIVHRDIKLENVLVNISIPDLSSISDWQTYPHPVVTLTDLGLGRWIPKPPESALLNTRCGSEDYAAPEVLMGQEYDGRATDAWALGVLLYAIMEGRLPFDPVPGAKRKSQTSHRIARCEWNWVKWGESDGEWDTTKGAMLEGARKIVVGLLARAIRRWSLEMVEATDWVSQGLNVEGGLKYVEVKD